MTNPTSPQPWPPITILIVTYDRPREIRRTIDALLSHLTYKGPLSWHLADDGSPIGYIRDLVRDYRALNFKITITHRGGWGVNVNTALRTMKTSYVFSCEDDYVAHRPLDLTSGIALMESEPGIGLVRYDGLSGHTLNLYLREADTRIGRFDYLAISRESPHLNVYSNRPHLKHKRFHDALGLYREGVSLGATETDFAHRVKDKDVGCPVIATLQDGIPRAFDHIGRSRQGSEYDLVSVKEKTANDAV